MDRRQFLRASAVALPTVGLGQSVTATASGSRPVRGVQAGDVPEYAAWVAADEQVTDENGEAWVGSLDVPKLLTLVSQDEDDDSEDDDEGLPLSFEAYGITAFFAIFSWPTLDEFGIAEPVLGQNSASATNDPVTTDPPVDRYTVLGQTSIYTGSIDAGEIAAAIEAGDAVETDSEGIYTLDAEFSQQFVTWGDGYVLVGQNLGELETVRAAGEGEVARRHEENDDFARLLAAGGTGDYALTRLAPSGQLTLETDEIFQIDYDPLVGAVGYAQSNWFDIDARRLDSLTVVAYGSEGDVDQDRLAGLGADASQRSSSRDGRFVTIETGYEEDFFSDGGSTDEDTTDDGSDGTDDSSDDGDTTDGSGEDSTGDGDSSGEDSTGDGDGTDSTDGADDSETTTDGDDAGTNETADDAELNETDEDESGDDTDDDDAENADDDGAGLGVLTALSGLGGAGYLLSRRVGSEE